MLTAGITCGSYSESHFHRLMLLGLKALLPPCGTLLKLEARGIQDNLKNSLELLISHLDGYALTATPVVACLVQYLDGNICKPGLWFQAHIVEPWQFFNDMEKMGAHLKLVTKENEDPN